MKKIVALSFLVLVVSNCTENKKAHLAMNQKEDQSVYVTTFYYLHENEKSIFDDYQSKVASMYTKYHGQLTKKMKPLQLVKGNIELPSEVHMYTYKNEEDYNKLIEDPQYLSLTKAYKELLVKKPVTFISKDAHANIPLEIGDTSKMYAMTILTYKEGKNHQENFETYLEKSCAIMPEFGVHFEQFLIPIKGIGTTKIPNKIHLFYFDSKEGLQEMIQDPRMIELFPLRDQSLKEAHLFLGTAS